MIATISFVTTIGLQIASGKISMVQTCPETKAAWDHRSSAFKCEDEETKYHCVMDSTWTLVEICISPLNISQNQKGCPWIYKLVSKAFWMFPFSPCPVQNTECPQEGHGGYTSEQLFKYPSCFNNISERTSGGTELQQTTADTTKVSKDREHWEEFYRSDVMYLPYLSMFTLLLICTLLVLYFLQNRTIRNLIKEVKAQRMKTDDSQSSTASSISGFELKENKCFLLSSLKPRSRNGNENGFKDEGDGNSTHSNDVKGHHKTLQVSTIRTESRRECQNKDDTFPRHQLTVGLNRNLDTPQSLPELNNESRGTKSLVL